MNDGLKFDDVDAFIADVAPAVFFEIVPYMAFNVPLNTRDISDRDFIITVAGAGDVYSPCLVAHAQSIADERTFTGSDQ